MYLRAYTHIYLPLSGYFARDEIERCENLLSMELALGSLVSKPKYVDGDVNQFALATVPGMITSHLPCILLIYDLIHRPHNQADICGQCYEGYGWQWDG